MCDYSWAPPSLEDTVYENRTVDNKEREKAGEKTQYSPMSRCEAGRERISDGKAEDKEGKSTGIEEQASSASLGGGTAKEHHVTLPYVLMSGYLLDTAIGAAASRRRAAGTSAELLFLEIHVGGPVFHPDHPSPYALSNHISKILKIINRVKNK